MSLERQILHVLQGAERENTDHPFRVSSLEVGVGRDGLLPFLTHLREMERVTIADSHSSYDPVVRLTHKGIARLDELERREAAR